MSLYDVVRRPVITEKSTMLAEDGRYTFEVAVGATKTRVKEAVETAFGVKVAQVNVMSVRGKRKRFGPRLKAKPSWRKAVVTLAKGEKIEFFGGG
jgi:large subunit ribosomal protein L23